MTDPRKDPIVTPADSSGERKRKLRGVRAGFFTILAVAVVAFALYGFFVLYGIAAS